MDKSFCSGYVKDYLETVDECYIERGNDADFITTKLRLYRADLEMWRHPEVGPRHKDLYPFAHGLFELTKQVPRIIKRIHWNSFASKWYGDISNDFTLIQWRYILPPDFNLSKIEEDWG